jgi:simple sugar transport system substrate-binding protein/ribose transport system substrate-binding protein
VTSLFVSYSRIDGKFVQRLADDLRAAGYTVWVDISGLRGGDDWVREIDEKIRACDAMVLTLSPDSIASEWVRRETTLAQHLDKPVVPVMPRDTNLPVHLITTQFVDFRSDYDDALPKLLEALPPPPEPEEPEVALPGWIVDAANSADAGERLMAINRLHGIAEGDDEALAALAWEEIRRLAGDDDSSMVMAAAKAALGEAAPAQPASEVVRKEPPPPTPAKPIEPTPRPTPTRATSVKPRQPAGEGISTGVIVGGLGALGAIAAVVVAVLLATGAFGGGGAEEPASEESAAEEPAAEEPVAEEPAEEEEFAVPEDITIGYAARSSSVLWYSALAASIEQYAGDFGWEVIVTDADGDVELQITQIEALVAMGVDAIVTSPADAEVICQVAIEVAKDAGIPVYALGTSPSCQVNMSVLPDYYRNGEQGAAAVLGFLNEKYGAPRGTVLELRGDTTSDQTQRLTTAFNNVMAEYPEVGVISAAEEWDPDAWRTSIDEVVNNEQVGEIDAIFMHTDCFSWSIINKLEDQGMLIPHGEGYEEFHIFLAGSDGCEEGLQAIRDGYFDYTSSNATTDYGIVVEWIAQELAAQPIQDGVVEREGAPWSPARIVTNVYGTPELLLTSTGVTIDNVDDPELWGNQGTE